MQLRDHDKPCKHPNYAQHINGGEYWWCGVCPGGELVDAVDVPWCWEHDQPMMITGGVCLVWVSGPYGHGDDPDPCRLEPQRVYRTGGGI